MQTLRFGKSFIIDQGPLPVVYPPLDTEFWQRHPELDRRQHYPVPDLVVITGKDPQHDAAIEASLQALGIPFLTTDKTLDTRLGSEIDRRMWRRAEEHSRAKGPHPVLKALQEVLKDLL